MEGEVSLEFMTGNPQLGVLSGRLTHLESGGGRASDRGEHSPEDGSSSSSSSGGGGGGGGGQGSGNTKPADYDNISSFSGCSASTLHRQLPERRSRLLCILSVPAHMVPTDMLQFTAPFKDHVHSIRIVRPCNPAGPSDPARTPAEYMVLLQMKSQSSADDFFLQCNGKPFNSFEEAVCRVVFVATVTFDLASPASSPSPTSARVGAGAAATLPASAFDASATPTSSGNPSAATPPPPPPSMRPALLFSPISGSGGHASGGGGVAKAGAAAGVGGGGILSPEEKAAAAATVADAAWEYDAATCVICMDRMESRVLTTVCNHSFHVECLMKWQDSPCPVCRFHHNNASEASTCQECQATDNLWVCLICGSVLCGARHEDHVRGHYTSTLHAYAIEIETQQVWDFAGDGFVHRLIHNKADGKLVEISDPGQTSEERPQMPARLSDVQEERLVHGKLEGLAYQFNTLLTSQLDEQRHFYQKQLNELLEEQEKNRRERKARMVSGADLISALRQQRRELESKCTSASTRLRKIREETGFLWELNRSLEANKPQLSANLEQARRELDSARRAREEWVPKLEEKVAALMLKLDAGVAAAAAAVTGKTAAGAAAAAAAAGSATAAAGRNAAVGVVENGGAVAAFDGSVAAARGFGVATKAPPAAGTAGEAGDGGAGGQAVGRGGGAEEAKGAGASAGVVRSGDRAGLSAAGGAAGESVDDDRGSVAEGDGGRRYSSSLPGTAGGGSSSGKKKGRRRKSK